jgi:GH35 family endo-1,4-beta-xylanase
MVIFEGPEPMAPRLEAASGRPRRVAGLLRKAVKCILVVTVLPLALGAIDYGSIRHARAGSAIAAAGPAQGANAGPEEYRDDPSPWGVATGAEWIADYPKFNPLLHEAGVKWLRGFPPWQAIEPQQGEWSWAKADALVANARAHNIRLTAPLAYLAPWVSAHGDPRKFPIKDMQYWRDFVAAVVGRYHEDIKY